MGGYCDYRHGLSGTCNSIDARLPAATGSVRTAVATDLVAVTDLLAAVTDLEAVFRRTANGGRTASGGRAASGRRRNRNRRSRFSRSCCCGGRGCGFNKLNLCLGRLFTCLGLLGTKDHKSDHNQCQAQHFSAHRESPANVRKRQFQHIPEPTCTAPWPKKDKT
jgi:hypothetical protein